MWSTNVSRSIGSTPHTDTPYRDDEEAYVTFSSLEKHAPEGWRMFTHPRGSIYFRNDQHKLTVDEDIRIPSHLAKAEAFCASHVEPSLPDHMEIFMAYGVDASTCLYVNHRQCVASYDLAKITAGSIIRKLPVDSCKSACLSSAFPRSHSVDISIYAFAVLRFRRLYWNFVRHHPSHCP